MPASQTAGKTQQRNSLAQINQSQSSVPSSPILLVPRRRTKSTPNAGTCYVAASPPVGSSTRKRRDYAYQKYSTNDLNDVDSVDMDDGFDAVQNIDSSKPQEAAAASSNDVVGDNPFDDFDGTPVVSHGDESRSTSSSSSSSITHRRRRGSTLHLERQYLEANQLNPCRHFRAPCQPRQHQFNLAMRVPLTCSL